MSAAASDTWRTPCCPTHLTRAEYQALLERHSLELLREVETGSGLSIFEAIAR
jgi:hypothetical protein